MSAPATATADAPPAAVEPTQPTVSCPLDSSPSHSPSTVVLGVYAETKECERRSEDAARVDAEKREKGEEKEEMLWYFAIGSMMNPTSMNLRNLFPRQSKPGILYGWKLIFRGGGGMGDIDQGTPEDNFHGVLHQVTKAEFAHLDSIESIYDRVPVKVTCYDGSVIDAGVYKMDQTKLESTANVLPSERYLDIIIRGAIHHGVAPEYIEKLRKVPVIPRKKPSEYRLLPNPPDVAITPEQLAAGTGADGKELLLSIHGKVLRFCGDPNSSAAVRVDYEWMRDHWAAQEVCVSAARTLYEPLYPVPTTYEAMSYEMRTWAEELFYDWSGAPHPPSEPYRLCNWEVIGWLEGQRGGR